MGQSFPKLYMRLPLPDLGKLKDYVPEMLAIESIDAGNTHSLFRWRYHFGAIAGGGSRGAAAGASTG